MLKIIQDNGAITIDLRIIDRSKDKSSIKDKIVSSKIEYSNLLRKNLPKNLLFQAVKPSRNL